MLTRARSICKETIFVLSCFQFLVFVSGTNAPLSVVVSGSMEPAISRGDVAILYNSEKPLEVGEVVAFRVVDDGPTILHRIIAINETDHTILTKGDNNWVSDAHFLYQGRLPKERVDSRVWAIVPYIGRPFTWIIEWPLMKYTLFGLFTLRDLCFPEYSLW